MVTKKESVLNMTAQESHLIYIFMCTMSCKKLYELDQKTHEMVGSVITLTPF